MLIVACRGSWMSGTNEILGCPHVKFCLCHFSSIFISISWMPGAVLIFVFKHLPFFNIYLHFFQKTPPLDAPGWMTGAVAPPHSPLHATEQAILCSYETLRQ